MSTLHLAEIDFKKIREDSQKEYERFDKEYGGFIRWPEVKKVYDYVYTRGYLAAELADKHIFNSKSQVFTGDDVDKIQLQVDEKTVQLKKIADEQQWILNCLPEPLLGGVLAHAQINGENDYYLRKSSTFLQ